MMNDKNSMLWLFLLFTLMSEGSSNAFTPPSNEEICKVFSNKLEGYLNDNKPLVEKANADSPIGQIYRLLKASKKIEDPDIRAEVLSVGMSVLSNIEKVNNYCCGGTI